MTGLVDLFNPTFFMFLGILVLVVAVLVAYFESKIRDQNHKIASMLSLVSTLAEDMNGVKMGLNQISEFNRSIGGKSPSNLEQPLETKTVPFNPTNTLIEVSDDDYDDDDDDDDDVDEYDYDNDDDDDDDDEDGFEHEDEDDPLTISADVDLGIIDAKNYSDIDDDNENDLKIFTLNLTQEPEKPTNSVTKLQLNEINSEPDTELKTFEETDANLRNENESSATHDISNNLLDLKSINSNLEETSVDHSDYKKLSLPKLRSIVSEKGLSQDATKLKKNEILKLLE